jgi:hypothetical protein
MFSMAEIDLATSLAQNDFDPTHVKPPESLRPYVSPGRTLDGWICQVKYSLIDPASLAPPSRGSKIAIGLE